MVTAKFSTNFEAVRSRLKRLPKLMAKTLETSSKKDALGLIATYQDGLKKDNLKSCRTQINT